MIQIIEQANENIYPVIMVDMYAIFLKMGFFYPKIVTEIYRKSEQDITATKPTTTLTIRIGEKIQKANL